MCASAVGISVVLYPTNPPQQQIIKDIITAAYPILHSVGLMSMQLVPCFHNEKAPTIAHINTNKLATAKINFATLPPFPELILQNAHYYLSMSGRIGNLEGEVRDQYNAMQCNPTQRTSINNIRQLNRIMYPRHTKLETSATQRKHRQYQTIISMTYPRHTEMIKNDIPVPKTHSSRGGFPSRPQSTQKILTAVFDTHYADH